MSKIQELYQQRAKVIDQAQEMLRTADNEKRDLTTEEKEIHDGLLAQIDDLKEQIERREKLEGFAAEAEKLQERQVPAEDGRGMGGDFNPALGMEDKDIANYSIFRAIDAAVTKNWNKAGLELEASRAVAAKYNKQPSSFFIPFDVLDKRDISIQKRDVTVGTPSSGGYLVSTDTLAPIDILTNRMVVRQAGAMVLDGLVGDVEIPVLTASTATYWVAEAGAPTEGAPTTGQRTLTPHTLGAYIDLTRRFRLQTSPAAENLFLNDMMRAIALGLDLAALYGSAASNQPRGVINVSGIGAPGTGAATRAMVVGLETAVAADNADMGRLAYITDATVRGALKLADVGTDTGRFVWEAGSNEINGYPALVSNQVTDGHMFFGNWGDLIIGLWSGIDVNVDTASLSTSGGVRVVMFQDADIAVRHPESFAKDQTS